MILDSSSSKGESESSDYNDDNLTKTARLRQTDIIMGPTNHDRVSSGPRLDKDDYDRVADVGQSTKPDGKLSKIVSLAFGELACFRLLTQFDL